MASCVALILAGGSGVRLGSERPKQYLALAGRAVIRHSAETFLRHPAVSAVRVMIRDEDRAPYHAAMAGLDTLPPVVGGATRQESARRGLESLAPLAPERVLIHDAARPLVDSGVIDRALAALDGFAGAVPCVPVADTLKRGAAPGAAIGGTVDRAGLWRAQTPQAFRFSDILAAHRAHQGADLTDDAAVAERAGLKVALVMGAEDNIKITTQDDLARAERLLAGAAETRVGTGFDVHKFAPGERVMLCGVAVPHERGLAGHSDADVALHALTDAILGALGAGDIGLHFPPSDPKWRNADSAIFIRHAAGLVAARGGSIVHLDLTLICERPRVGPHREAMIKRLSEILGLAPERISIKATTTEGLGFTGRSEGIAAQAAATIRVPMRP
jgi:2-C-methyl-D-erythritol 4-phosphate cytidylyltransferase/2-C-methyl-D-erythritol 2,4-cyclodiphosphate synthase